jgi:peptidoglycan/LPS O-acetylase OafA/YrhL
MNASHRLINLFLAQPLQYLYRPPKGQIASLDFLRSCAILLVLAFHFSHAYLGLGGTANTFSRLPVVLYGRIGVDLFFVLSGYFIGKQLWREMSQSGVIDIKRFVLRRGLRIWPLYYAVLAFVVVGFNSRGGYSWEGVWANLLFFSNYFPRLDIVPGSWSLSVEEQFYIFTPLLLLVGATCKLPLRWYRGVLIALLAVLPLVRLLVLWRLTGGLHTPLAEDLRLTYLHKPFHVCADGLVMGLLLAHLEVIDGDRFKRGLLGSALPVFAGVGIFVMSFRSVVLSSTGCAFLFGSCTWYLVARRRKGLRVLESWGFFVLSRLSYGMYLNHFYLLQSTGNFTLGHLVGVGWAPAAQQIAGTLLFITTSVGVAVVTFCLIEWPFLRLREWVLSDRNIPHLTKTVVDRRVVSERALGGGAVSLPAT